MTHFLGLLALIFIAPTETGCPAQDPPTVTAKLRVCRKTVIPGEPLVLHYDLKANTDEPITIFFPEGDSPWVTVSYTDSKAKKFEATSKASPWLPIKFEGKYSYQGGWEVMTRQGGGRFVLQLPRKPVEGEIIVHIRSSALYRAYPSEWPPSSCVDFKGDFKVTIAQNARRDLAQVADEVASGSYLSDFGYESSDFLIQIPIASSKKAWLKFLHSKEKDVMQIFSAARMMTLSGQKDYKEFVPEIANTFSDRNPNLASALYRLYNTGG